MSNDFEQAKKALDAAEKRLQQAKKELEAAQRAFDMAEKAYQDVCDHEWDCGQWGSPFDCHKCGALHPSVF